ncbi:MAG TPA: YegS/Rv2252/BmrU family lipid kinase [Candidatus Deferrimicrobiaceae bacterium]|nr:YegS/Rv2252/BmrU family lipid kinase [Candidatus Deferrimicrobiaceae bacterium]
MSEDGRYLAIVNPAAGGGRSRKMLGPALERLRAGGVAIEVKETRGAGEATQIAREAYRQGFRKFIAVGGDGTSYEVVNGLFPQASAEARPSLGFLPLGTGNSFLRDFSDRGVEHAIDSLISNRTQACDVLRLRHRGGVVHYINLLSVGFPADVATLRARRFSGHGELGYVISIFLGLVRLERRPFPVRVDGETEFDRRRCLFLTFNNSKFTGGTMMIAPKAETNSGLIEYVRWGAIGRLGLMRNLPGLYDGTHIHHPLAERKAVRKVEFDLNAPVDVMVDGEVLTLQCEALDVLPGALHIVA